VANRLDLMSVAK